MGITKSWPCLDYPVTPRHITCTAQKPLPLSCCCPFLEVLQRFPSHQAPPLGASPGPFTHGRVVLQELTATLEKQLMWSQRTRRILPSNPWLQPSPAAGSSCYSKLSSYCHSSPWDHPYETKGENTIPVSAAVTKSPAPLFLLCPGLLLKEEYKFLLPMTSQVSSDPWWALAFQTQSFSFLFQNNTDKTEQALQDKTTVWPTSKIYWTSRTRASITVFSSYCC